ncbi:MAG TPA: serine/threonine-protein kinase [Vicinamibacteria bacterium]|nr:serine/threonine-protein kinase [Vicinamibacteria bacterium]
MPARLSEDRWRVVIPYLDRGLELAADDRPAWLAAVAAHDPELARELTELLDQHDRLDAQGFLAGAAPRPAAAGSLEGQTLGAYTLRSRLGQGGMGSVWLGERSDGRFEGVAAVKLLNASLVGRDGEARFRREGSILARLRHPCIAQLIDAGVSPQGQPYLVLEHVDGQRVDDYCDAQGLGVDARVRLFLDVLAAVAHAHANLIVHRDLKPSNVLVDGAGRVKLLDFGIAKMMEGAAGETPTALTRDGESMLTPEYAAPEQLTAGDVTTATDVYALGVLLYILLAGRHPAWRESQSPAELVRAIVDTEATRVSDAAATGENLEERAQQRATTTKRLRGVLRGDLDNIVAKALKKAPAERYPSAEAMAEDLNRYLDQLPVRARADSLGYRTRKFVTRHQVGLGAAAAVVIALATGAGVAVQQARTAARARDRALVDLRRAEATVDFTGFLLAEATPMQGRPITNAELLAHGDALLDLRYADDPATRVHMLLILADRYQENQQYDRWHDAAERAFTFSRGISDVGLRSRAACAKALVLVDEGLRDPATMARANELLAEARSDLAASPGFEADEAYCLVREANVGNKVGEWSRSIPAAQRAVALEEARGASATRRFEAGLALGNSYLVKGAPEDADAQFTRLMQLLDSQGLGRTRDATLVLNNWSRMWQIKGRHLKALPLSERALAIGRERATERGVVSVIIRNHAAALNAVGRCAEALPLVEEVIAKARDEKSVRRMPAVLELASAVYSCVGRFDAATDALREAERLLAADPKTTPNQNAFLDEYMARLALAQGDAAAAVTHAERGLARPQVGDDILPLELVLAEAYNERGDPARARAVLERARPGIEDFVGSLPDSLWSGSYRLERGIALVGLGDVAAGREELRKAVEQLEASVGPEARSTRRAKAHLQEAAPPS